MAYIDPSTGGMLFQVLAAGFAVLSGAALIFSRQIRVLLSRVRRSLRGATGVGGALGPDPSEDGGGSAVQDPEE